SHVRLYDREGRPAGDVVLPSLGTVAGLTGHTEGHELFVPFTSFLSPTKVLRQSVGVSPPGAAPARKKKARRGRAVPALPAAGESPAAGAPSPEPPAVWRAVS